MQPGPAPFVIEAYMPEPAMFRQNIESVYCKCTNCYQSVHTKFCLISFCIDSLYDRTHMYPYCRFIIGWSASKLNQRFLHKILSILMLKGAYSVKLRNIITLVFCFNLLVAVNLLEF